MYCFGFPRPLRTLELITQFWVNSTSLENVRTMIIRSDKRNFGYQLYIVVMISSHLKRIIFISSTTPALTLFDD
jgi:hypothetical protein